VASLGRAAPRERRDHRPEPDALGRAGDRGEGDLQVADRRDRFAPAQLIPDEGPVPTGFLGLRAQPRDERGIGELVEGRDVEAEAHQVCSRIAATIASQSAR